MVGWETVHSITFRGFPSSAEALLARPFTLVADDPLTGFSATWPVAPEAVAEWLIARRVESAEDEDEDEGLSTSLRAGDARLVLTVQEGAVCAYLEGLGNQLTAEVALDVEGTLPAVRAAVEAGEGRAAVALVHSPRTYTVQPGDTLVSVARAHGFPAWRLTEANPDVAPGQLRPGQQIVIPSQARFHQRHPRAADPVQRCPAVGRPSGPPGLLWLHCGRCGRGRRPLPVG